MTKDWIDSYDQVDDNRAAFKRRLEYCLSELTIQQYPGYDDLLDLIHSCLSIDPSRRITSERALKHAWLKRVEFIPPNFNNACGENYFYEPKMPENILYHC
jgi:serine/threonine protein kinase